MLLFTLDRDILTTEASVKASATKDNVAYVQASNLRNQLGNQSGKIVTYSGVDGLHQYRVYKNGSVAPKNAGVYLGIYAAQIGSPRGNGKGEIHIWSRRNGQNEPNSNSAQTVERGGTSVLVYATVFQTLANRGAELVFSAIVQNACGQLGLIATDFGREPVVPSIISSEIQISNGAISIDYAALSSLNNQFGSTTGQSVKLNRPDTIKGVSATMAEVDGSISLTASKLYFAIACGQVGGGPNREAEGFVHLWLQLGGVAIKNSNTIQSVRKGSTAVLVTQTIFLAEANQNLQIMFSSTDDKLGLIASTPTDEPTVPSMIFIIVELGTQQESIPYAQFSSSESQWGCSTPKPVLMANNDDSKRISNRIDFVEFLDSGTYILIAAAQVGSADRRGIGDVHLWMRLNGEDMANSNAIQTIYETDTSVLVIQTVVVLKAGDQVQVMFSTDPTEGQLGLVFTEAGKEPAVPSIIFSAFKSYV